MEEEQKVGVEKKKSNIKVYILIAAVVVLIVIIVLLLLNNYLFVKRIREANRGHFEKRDGVDTYLENGQVVVNSLVRIKIKGDKVKLYYVDDKGHKVKNSWQIIDNDGNYGYFGSLGELVVNKVREIDGKLYFFDENGVLFIDKTGSKLITVDGANYYSSATGELAQVVDGTLSAKDKVEETSVVAKTSSKTQNITQTTAATLQTTAISQTTKAQSVTQSQNQVQTGPPISNTTTTVAATTQNVNVSGLTTEELMALAIAAEEAGETETTKRLPSSSGPTTVETAYPGPDGKVAVTDDDDKVTTSSSDVKISSTEKITDTVEGDDYDCTIVLLKPIMVGADDNETANLNACIDDMMNEMWDSVETIVNDYSSLPKSVKFTSASLGTVKTNSIQINLTGTLTTKAGSTKTIKYRITYDRESGDATLTKVSG